MGAKSSSVSLNCPLSWRTHGFDIPSGARANEINGLSGLLGTAGTCLGTPSEEIDFLRPPRGVSERQHWRRRCAQLTFSVDVVADMAVIKEHPVLQRPGQTHPGRARAF